MLGVNIAIFQDGRILLTQREDFEVWCLPGGEVDPGESLSQAALREAREETGLEVALTRLVGIYCRPGGGGWSGTIVVFAAHPLGGELRAQQGEVIDLRYFAPAEIPVDLVNLHQQRIRDALNGVGGGGVWRQQRAWPFPIDATRQDIYRLRDESGLSKREFHLRYMTRDTVELQEIPQSQPASGTPAVKLTEKPVPSPNRLPRLGVSIAILKDDKLLLTRREDFEVWCLPGGEVDADETVGQAARREALEEVGLEITLTRLVGVYSDPTVLHTGVHNVILAARPTGGELCLEPSEVLEARFFGPDELPQDFQFGNRQRALDALSGAGGGVIWAQNLPWPFETALTREQIYALRDRSGLSRADFYRQYLGGPAAEFEVMELNPNGDEIH